MTPRLSPLVLAGALAVAACLPARASDAPTLPDWSSLTPAQRELLIAPVRERWNSRPADRARMLRHAQRWNAMTPEQRANARRGVDRWQKMSPVQREEARAIFKRTRDLDPEQRRQLRERLKAMTPEQRRAWLQSQAAPAQR